LLFAAAACAKDAAPAAADPEMEARMLSIAAELRCLVCQNQTIADSHASLAVDLRRDIREQLARGATDDQVVQYMTDRYGDFIRYRRR
jgi:cytochrome c-type biogenesis protein CcmH